MIETLSLPSTHGINPAAQGKEISFVSNMTPEGIQRYRLQSQKYITAGDIIQVVLSQRFETDCQSSAVDLYRGLRYVNPSPYLFFLKLDDLALIGSSPEVMVRLEGDTMELRPIAGTRRRGKPSRRTALWLMSFSPMKRNERSMLCSLIWAETI